MGNSCNKTVSNGGTAPDAGDPECEQLQQDVEQTDQQIKKEIAEGSATPESAKRKLNAHKASTVSSSKATCGNKVMRKPAYSSLKRLPVSARKNYAQGTHGGRSNMCRKPNGRAYRHTPNNGRSSCNHTEGRFIEDLFKTQSNDGRLGGSCTLVMKIKWKQRKLIKDTKGRVVRVLEKPPLDKPCPRCEKTICHAMYCGLKILLCKTENGKQQKREPTFCKKS